MARQITANIKIAKNKNLEVSKWEQITYKELDEHGIFQQKH